MQSLDTSRREATPGAPPGRTRGRLRLASALLGLAAALLVFMPSLARADSASTLSIVGTSDVSDSGLWQNVLQPAFKAAYPQYASKYTGSATGVAIAAAQSGSGSASVLIVHAASLENTFVSGGFSYNNQYGNAIFTNSFVVAGPTADPAGVAAAGGTNNAARSFASIAAAGVAGKATYLSRGGTTTASGTTVEEHAIWQLVYSSGLTPAGVVLCNVSSAAPNNDGGGMTPINPTVQATSGQPCPDSGSVSAADVPSWEVLNPTPITQAGNVVAANACTETGVLSGANSCYTLTDIGTWDYLSSGNSPSGAVSGTTGNLSLVSRDNSETAPGGANELVNYFHAYIINPSAPNETVNLPAAQAFMSLITSPAVQAQIAQYLNTTTDPGGAPFKPTASPGLTETGLGATVNAGDKVTVSGQVTNQQPGYAAVAGQTVTVNQVVGGTPLPVATGTTSSTGAYSIAFVPPSSGSYTVSTGAISLIEEPNLSPAYGDLLAPASTAAANLVVNGSVAITAATASPGRVAVAGNIGPAAPDANGTVTLLSRPAGSNSNYTAIGSQTLAKGQATFAVNGNVTGGSVSLVAVYSDPGQLTSATSAATTLAVPKTSVAAKKAFSKLKLKGRKLTLSGSLAQAPTATSGTVVHLYAMSVGTVKVAKKKHTTKGKKTKKVVRAGAITDAATSARFKQVAKVTVRKGLTNYTIKHTFAAGHRYVLQLKYTGVGQTGSYSGYKYITVK